MTAKFRRRYKNGTDFAYERHAEVDLLLKLKEVPDKICVIRFLDTGEPTMAKPCKHCQNFLRLKGVKKVRYTNWKGEWEEINLI